MVSPLKESLADIEALAHRVTWELMDEAQRDEFMTKIVVPRWGKTTSDGVVLKGTAWANLIGTSEPTVRNRYLRLTRRSETDSGRSPADAPTESQKGNMRGARSAMRAHPELVKELLADAGTRDTIVNAVVADKDSQLALIRAQDKRHPRTEPKKASTPEPFARLLAILHVDALTADADAMYRAVVEKFTGAYVWRPGEKEALLTRLDHVTGRIADVRAVLTSEVSDDDLAQLLGGEQ